MKTALFALILCSLVVSGDALAGSKKHKPSKMSPNKMSSEELAAAREECGPSISTAKKNYAFAKANIDRLRVIWEREKQVLTSNLLSNISKELSSKIDAQQSLLSEIRAKEKNLAAISPKERKGSAAQESISPGKATLLTKIRNDLEKLKGDLKSLSEKINSIFVEEAGGLAAIICKEGFEPDNRALNALITDENREKVLAGNELFQFQNACVKLGPTVKTPYYTLESYSESLYPELIRFPVDIVQDTGNHSLKAKMAIIIPSMALYFDVMVNLTASILSPSELNKSMLHSMPGIGNLASLPDDARKVADSALNHFGETKASFLEKEVGDYCMALVSPEELEESTN